MPEPVPRENYEAVGSPEEMSHARPCVLCGLPIPLKPYFFICPKHTNGGWCFDKAQAESVARDMGMSLDEFLHPKHATSSGHNL